MDVATSLVQAYLHVNGYFMTTGHPLGVPGVTVEQVKGYGEHPNFFRRDLMYGNARLVLYADEDNVAGIVSAIARCAKESHAPGRPASYAINEEQS